MSAGRLGRNVIAGGLSQVCSMVVAFVATPLLVRGLGANDYGLWQVATALGTWVGFVNMVFSTSAVRFVGQAIGRQDASAMLEAQRALTTWAWWCALAGAGLLCAAAPWLTHHGLTIEPSKYQMAITVLCAQAAFAACQMLTAVNGGIVGAHQRLDIFYAIRTVSATLQSGGAAVVVLSGGGLTAVVWWVAGIQALEWLTFRYWAKRLQPATTTRPRQANLRAWGRQLIVYGGPLLVGYAAAQLFLPMSRILIGHLRPLAEVAYFTIPATLAGNTRVISTYVANAVLPAVSECAGRNDAAGLKHLYLRGLRWSWLTMVPLAGLALALGGPFIGSWIRWDIGQHAAPLVAPLVFGLCIHFLGGIPEVVLQGMGRPMAWVVISLGAGVVHVALGWCLIARYGAWGGAEALLIASGLSTGLLCGWMHRLLRVTWRDYRVAVMPRVLVVAAIVAVVLRIVVGERHLPLLPVLGLGAAGTLALALTALWWLPSEEQSWCRRQWAALTGHEPRDA